MAAVEQLRHDRGDLTVGELAARSGVAVSALHFYERQG
jgi:MerR family redox-sensitive transcriptional activator SoxR